MDGATRRGWARGLATGVLGLVSVAFLLNRGLEALLPPRAEAICPDKLRALAAAGPVDIVFVGSSRVEADVDPRLVDAELFAAGRPLRSYNLGVPALTFVEEARLVERLS